jgi:hypothetical protein
MVWAMLIGQHESDIYVSSMIPAMRRRGGDFLPTTTGVSNVVIQIIVCMIHGLYCGRNDQRSVVANDRLSHIRFSRRGKSRSVHFTFSRSVDIGKYSVGSHERVIYRGRFLL